MVVKARLDGHSIDLDTVERLFGNGDPLVGRDGQGYYLASPSLDPVFQDGGRLTAAASELLRRVNGAARVLDSSFQPVRLVGNYSNGDHAHHVVVADTAYARAQAMPIAVVVNGVAVVPEAPTLGERYTQLASLHPDVAEALDLLGRDDDPLSWAQLWKVYEVVREHVGGPSRGTAKQVLIGKGWVSQAEIEAFEASANTKSISGDDARHARGHAPQGSGSMTVEEGRAMISALMQGWANSF